jgi:hypothetical protein
MAPHRHLVVYVAVTSARTNTNVPHISARLPLPGKLALGAERGKLATDLRTFALLGTPSVQSVHEYYLCYLIFVSPIFGAFFMDNFFFIVFDVKDLPGVKLSMGAGWRLWRLSWLIASLFWWESATSLSWVHRTLIHSVMTVMSACGISFVDLFMFPFDVCWGMCGENSRNVFLLLFMVLWASIFATLCMRAMLMLWFAFLFLLLRRVGVLLVAPFCLVVSNAFSSDYLLPLSIDKI